MCLTTDRIAGSGSVTHDDPISQRYLVVIMGYESETHATFMGERRVDEALELSLLHGFDQRVTTELSGGEQQRLALAGVLAMRPRYLVLL